MMLTTSAVRGIRIKRLEYKDMVWKYKEEKNWGDVSTVVYRLSLFNSYRYEYFSYNMME
jgi:hypothetical protein